jgi:hypothetical protein
MKPARNTGERLPDTVLAEGGYYHQADLLSRGYTVAQIASARRTHRLLGWRDRFGGWHCPKWQFGPDGKVDFQVERILRQFRSSDPFYTIGQFIYPRGTQKALLELIRNGHGDKAIEIAAHRAADHKREPKPTKRLLAALQRRVSELADPVRYIVASRCLGCAFVYDLANHSWCMDWVGDGCLIKKRHVARAIAQTFREGRIGRLDVLAVRKTKSGYSTLDRHRSLNRRNRRRLKFKTGRDTPRFVPITPPGSKGSVIDALVFALEMRDDLWRLIAESNDRADAVDRLVRRCGLLPEQANAVLEMRIAKLTKEDSRALREELREVVSGSAHHRRMST